MANKQSINREHRHIGSDISYDLLSLEELLFSAPRECKSHSA